MRKNSLNPIREGRFRRLRSIVFLVVVLVIGVEIIIQNLVADGATVSPFNVLGVRIRRILRPPLQNFITFKHESDLCLEKRADSADSASKPNHLAMLFLRQNDRKSILPNCPRRFDSAVEAVVFRPSTPASFGSSNDTALPPTLILHPTTICRVLIKVLKYLFTNKGCEVAIDHQSPLMRDELFEVVTLDYQRELTILTVGAHNNQSLLYPNRFTVEDFLFDYFSNIDAKVNIMGLRTDAEIHEAALKSKSEANFVSKVHRSPSSIHYCPYSSSKSQPFLGPAEVSSQLTWVPTNTFNVVLAFDAFSQMSAGLSNDEAIFKQQVCSYLHSLLRVTKIGGAVWVGHITHSVTAQLLMEGCWGTDVAAPICSSQRYGIELTVLEESPWLWASVRSQSQLYPRKLPANITASQTKRKRLLTTTFAGALVESKPKTFIFRKTFQDDEDGQRDAKSDSDANSKANVPLGKSVKINLNL